MRVKIGARPSRKKILRRVRAGNEVFRPSRPRTRDALEVELDAVFDFFVVQLVAGVPAVHEGSVTGHAGDPDSFGVRQQQYDQDPGLHRIKMTGVSGIGQGLGSRQGIVCDL